MQLNEFVQEYRRFGAVNTILDVGLRGLNRLVMARVLKAVRIETVDPEYLKCEEPYDGQFLTESQLTELIRDHPEYEMTGSFLREAFSKGDQCYGFLDGSILANYGWYSNRPTEINTPGMVLHFDPRYIYMYKGFTHLKYRGKRLHAISMTRALEAYLAQGFRGFVSYVEWNNFSSLKSCYRMGYADFGNLYLLRLFGKYVTWGDRSCRPYGFHLEYAPGVVEEQDPQTGQLCAPAGQKPVA